MRVRLHTARSRNDQVATDIRLYLRDAIDRFWIASAPFNSPCSTWRNPRRNRHAGTHLQVAQPVTFGHHLMAYFEMLKRDAAAW